MYVVIFEVSIKVQAQARYLEIAQTLRAEVEQIEGFISIERFSSLTNDGKLISVSYWESQNAIDQWRTQSNHQLAQNEGRQQLFSDYRICVARVERDYGMHDRRQALD